MKRIRGLVIPPGWHDVWICPHANGHIQAVGRDDRGRKQNRYHPQWEAARDAAKYDRITEFAVALPKIRQAVQRDLRLRGLPREKVLAIVVRLLETSHIRVGNAEYERQNGSYGLTTLKDHHVHVRARALHFRFRGKSAQWHEIEVNDQRLARLVRACQELPGQRLFQYLDDNGDPRSVGSKEVNDYLQEVSGCVITAKDFRTWAGTLAAAQALRTAGPMESATAAKRSVVQAIRAVAGQLGNAPATCRKCYVHPAVIQHYLQGKVLRSPAKRGRRGLSADELGLLALLRNGKATARLGR